MLRVNPSLAQDFQSLLARIQAASGAPVKLVAVSKTHSASAVRALAALGQQAFGENYAQEGVRKCRELADLALEWHFIGPLQSNKCKDIARHFDWLQTLDRASLIEPLARHRPPTAEALNVLIQVNIDDEDSKSGIGLEDLPELAFQVVGAPCLRLRGLMAIPAPWPDAQTRQASFRRLHTAFMSLKAQFPAIDTLSMGMSEDFEMAIGEGANLVRVGSAIFGARTHT